MQTATVTARSRNTWRELALLLLASLACVVVLTTAIVDRAGPNAGGGLLELILLITLVAGIAAVALLLVWHTTHKAVAGVRAAATEIGELRRMLVATEAIIKAEPQVLIYWEQGQGLKVVSQTLSGVPGLPQAQAELVRFGLWLDAKSAASLKSGLDALFADGRPFDLILRTTAGGYVEAEGRAAGARALLRMRDIAGYKRDVTTVLERQQVLARENSALCALLDVLPLPAWLRNSGGRITWVNAAYARSVEAADVAEVIDRQIELLDQPQRLGAERQLASGETYRRKLQLVTSGERKFYELFAVPSGDVTASAVLDVDTLQIAQDRLDQELAAYDRTLDRVATAVAIFNRDQSLVYFNTAYLNFWQLDAVWLASRPSHGAILDRLRELGRIPEVVNYRDWKSKVLSHDATVIGDLGAWHLPDGRVLRILSDQRPDGGVTCLYVDDTERLALESKYNALIGVQAETLNSLKEGVALFGTDGRLKLFNAAFAGIWQLSGRVLEEGPHILEVVSRVRMVHDDAETWTSITAAVTAFSDERHPFDGQMVRVDGSVIDFATMPLPDGATLLTFVDVTDAKRYQRALEERNEALLAAADLKNRFIGHVSYELRSPLTNIIGFSELLANPRVGELNDRQRDYLDHIASSSRTLLSIINDILDLATIDAGALELQVEHVGVREVIDAAIEGVHEGASRARLTLDIAIADDLTTVEADASRIRQMLYNLLSNAVGFSHPGGTVRLSAWRDGEEVAFLVEDEGIGIPPEQHDRVFDRFESRSHGSSHRGAGLGLAIVKSLAELHNGSVALDSEPGHGTRVTVRLPFCQHGAGGGEPVDHDDDNLEPLAG